MPTQHIFDFARIGYYGGRPISKAELKEKRKAIYRKAVALRQAARIGSPPENQLKLSFMEDDSAEKHNGYRQIDGNEIPGKRSNR